MTRPIVRHPLLIPALLLILLVFVAVIILIVGGEIGDARYQCFSRLDSRQSSADSYREFLGAPRSSGKSRRGEECDYYYLSRHSTGSVCTTSDRLLSRAYITISDPAYGPLVALRLEYAALVRHVTDDSELSRCLELETRDLSGVE